MTGELPRAVLERIRSVDWGGEGAAFDHARSRALLMKEYLRRAALWARVYGVPGDWPFFDLAEHVGQVASLPPDVAESLDSFLRSLVAPSSVKRTLRGAVHFASSGVQGTAHRTNRSDLLSPYEPLLVMYERGGGFSVNQQQIDLNGVSLPLWNADASITFPPLTAFGATALDALDAGARGHISYFAKIRDGYPRDRPSGVLRRRIVGRDERTFDEAFTRNLEWRPSEYFRLYELGHNDVDHVEISEADAVAFIDLHSGRITG